jgi:hypothetical protein
LLLREDCRDIFSLIVKKLGDSEEKLYSFMIGDEITNKSEFLTGLCKTICDSQCRADYVSISVLDRIIRLRYNCTYSFFDMLLRLSFSIPHYNN